MSSIRSLPQRQLLQALSRPNVKLQAPTPPPLRCTRSASSSTSSPKPRRSRGRFFWYGSVFITGAILGHGLLTPLPIPGTLDDEVALGVVSSDMDKLSIVKSMRAQGHDLHSDTSLGATGDGKKRWVELDIHKHITDSVEDQGRKTRTATQQSMAGARGLGVQRAFWNAETRELVAVVWIGGALAGWPGVTHGGVIATIFEDAMSRMVAGPNKSIDSIVRPTSMSVTYARPTTTLDYYILRASFSKPRLPQAAPPAEPEPAKSWLPWWKDLTKNKASDEGQSTVEISGTLESLKGDVCVRAKGTFPVGSI